MYIGFVPTDARTIAFRVLVRVDAQGAFASLALDAELKAAGRLDRREIALATELAYGTLRRQIALDHALAQVSSRPLDSLEPPVRAALRLGAYQLHHTRVAPHAAINESVDLAKRERHSHGAGYVNAVLRALTRTQASAEPRAETDPIGALALETSHPRWLVERWAAWIGFDEAAALCRANDAAAPTQLRVSLPKASRDEAAARLLADDKAQTEPTRRSPSGLVLVEGPPQSQLRSRAAGLVQAQDEGAQIVSLYADPPRGGRILDLCAAPGGKTCHLAELAGPEARVIAVDLSERKLDEVRAAAKRMSLPIDAHAADATLPLPFADEASFDLVLLDAPCSGLGTLRRHPELKTRRQPNDFASLVTLQAALLDRAQRYVRPGGHLVYAVCTLSAEECERQIDSFLERAPQFKRDPPNVADKAWADCVDARGHLVTLPHRHGTDGFFAARLRRSV